MNEEIEMKQLTVFIAINNQVQQTNQLDNNNEFQFSTNNSIIN